MSKVLVVDDSPVEQQLITGILSKDESLQVEAVGSGPAAMQHIKESPPDLVVTDADMPDVDGLELLRQIKIHFSDIPVIVLTTLDSEAMAIQALGAGASLGHDGGRPQDARPQAGPEGDSSSGGGSRQLRLQVANG